MISRPGVTIGPSLQCDVSGDKFAVVEVIGAYEVATPEPNASTSRMEFFINGDLGILNGCSS